MKKKKEQQVRRFEPQQDYSGPLLDVQIGRASCRERV